MEPAAKSPENTAEQFSLWRFVLGSWRDLFRGRESILLQIYVRLAGKNGISLDGAVTVAEVRQRFHDAFPSVSPIQADEGKVVLAHRLVSIWGVFWGTVLPTILLWIGSERGWVGPWPGWGDDYFIMIVGAGLHLGVLIILYVVVAIVCLFLQGFIAVLFVNAINRFLGWPKASE